MGIEQIILTDYNLRFLRITFIQIKRSSSWSWRGEMRHTKVQKLKASEGRHKHFFSSKEKMDEKNMKL